MSIENLKKFKKVKKVEKLRKKQENRGLCDILPELENRLFITLAKRSCNRKMQGAFASAKNDIQMLYG